MPKPVFSVSQTMGLDAQQVAKHLRYSSCTTTSAKGASPLAKSLKKLAPKCKRLNVFWN